MVHENKEPWTKCDTRTIPASIIERSERFHLSLNRRFVDVELAEAGHQCEVHTVPESSS